MDAGDGMSMAVFLVVVIGSFVIYCVPTFFAFLRGHRQLMPILIVNLFFGWTLLGWVICLAWAFSAQPDKSRRKSPRRGSGRGQDFSNLG